MQVACSACEKDNPVGFAFCGFCSALLGPQASADEERKTVEDVMATTRGAPGLTMERDAGLGGSQPRPNAITRDGLMSSALRLPLPWEATFAYRPRLEGSHMTEIPPAATDDSEAGGSRGHDAFVSYSRSDRDVVVGLVEGLTARGKRCWVDLEDIPPSAEWMAEVRGAIEAADGYLVVLSPALAASEVCAQELEHARGAGKRIVPVPISTTCMPTRDSS
jgi:hypothetical protein